MSNTRNGEFLNAVYQNAKMGIDSLNAVIPMVNDSKLATDLQDQLKNYNNMAAEAAIKLNEQQISVKDNSPFAKVGLWASIKVNMIGDSSTSHIAESVIQGSNMGIIDMTKNINHFTEIPPDIIDIGQRLVQQEHEHIQRLKSYL